MSRVLIITKPEKTSAGSRPLRIAQLDLLLRSLGKHWPEAELRVIDASAGRDFDQQVHRELECAPPFVAFMTDDGVLRDRIPPYPEGQLMYNELLLCCSLRLGINTQRCYPLDAPQAWPGRLWDWTKAEHDFGYPGSLDAHIFRTSDLLELLDEQYVPNPTALECCLDARCRELFAERRPLMRSPLLSKYVCVPVNRVSEQSGVRAGCTFPQSAEALRERFDAGERISLEAVEATFVDSPHTEMMFEWEPAPVPAEV